MRSFTTKDSLRLKGVAIIFMVIFHCLSSRERIGSHAVNFFPLDETTAIQLAGYTKICVTIFAFITGYGLYLSYTSPKRTAGTLTWALQRYIKTMSGFIFVYVLCVPVCGLFTTRMGRFFGGRSAPLAVFYMVLDALGLAKLLGTPSLMHGWWYMSAAAVFIVLVPLFCEVDRRVGLWPVALAVVAAPRILGMGFPGSTEIYSFVPALLMGMISAKHEVFARLDTLRLSSNSRVDASLQFLLYGLLVCLSVVLFIRLDKRIVWEYHYALSAVAVIIFSWKYLMAVPVVGTALEFLGTHSMNIYYVHSLMRQYLTPIVYASGSAWLIPLTLLVMALAVSLAIEQLKKLVGFARIQTWLLEHVPQKPARQAIEQ